ncbi:MAG TPA: hypothetical protein ENN69_01255, partial [Spirochaetia bacterium]|nr:hypothetical protein [Spirochaetia bacterium]
MLTKAHWLFLVLLLIGNTLTAQEKFVSEPGTIFLGGSLGINYSQDFGEKSVSLFSAALHPLFGEFLTRQIMLFTHFGFSIQNYAIGPGGVFDYPAWSGS